MISLFTTLAERHSKIVGQTGWPIQQLQDEVFNFPLQTFIIQVFQETTSCLSNRPLSTVEDICPATFFAPLRRNDQSTIGWKDNILCSGDSCRSHYDGISLPECRLSLVGMLQPL